MTAPCLEHRSQSFAWNAASFESSADYSLTLTDADRAELIAAVRALPDPRHPQSSGAEQFAMPGLSPRLAKASEDVRAGRGFVVLRGLAASA